MIADKQKQEKLKLQLQNLLKIYQSKKYNEAEDKAKTILKNFPNNQFCWKVLGVIYLQNGKILEAINANNKSVELNPQDAEAYYNLAITQKESGRLIEAEYSYNKAILINPNYYKAYNNIGNLKKTLGKLEEAENNYKKAILLKPDFAEAYYNLATVMQEGGKNKESEAKYKTAISIKPNYAEAYNNLGILFQDLSRLEESELCYKKAIELKPFEIDAFLNLCELLEKLNRLEEGLLITDRFESEDDSRLSDLLIYKALFLYRLNKVDISKKLISKINIEDLTDKRKIIFLNLKAKLYNDQKNYDHAFKNFKLMNEIIINTDEFKRYKSEEYYNELIKKLEQLQTLGIIIKNKQLIEPSWPQPTFLIGFPRSGTTLLDSILRTHSKINVAEEKPMLENVRRYFNNINDISAIEKIDYNEAKKASKIYFDELKNHLDLKPKELFVDKLPLNILYLPLIAQIFPKSKYIFALRHPLDCILSSWMQNFKLNNAMANMCDLNRTVDFYCTAMEFYNLSKQRYKLQIHTIRYEDLVNNFEKQVDDILSFLNLKWEDGLKDYYKLASKRNLINTPSYSQVVKPIYKSSTYRWKNYQKFLLKFENKLMPWLKIFGDLN